MFFDLKSYLVGKHGGAYTPSADLPSWLMGKAKSGGIQEITGTLPLTVRSLASQVLENYRIYGESVQDGTPTPDNPVELTGLGVRTVNLFGKDSAIIMNNTALYSDGTITHESGSYCAYIPCKGNTKYTISKTPSMRLRVGSTEGIPVINMRINNYYNSTSTKLATITTSGNDKYLFIYYYSYVNGDRVPEEDIRATIMVVEGSTAPSSYIPYGYKLPITVTANGTTTDYPVYIGDSQLMAEEYVDYEEQKVYKWTKNIFPSAAAETQVVDGVTATCDGNGRYSFSGTATSTTFIYFTIPKFTYPDVSTTDFVVSFFNNPAVNAACSIGSTVPAGLSTANRVFTNSTAFSGQETSVVSVSINAGSSYNFELSPMVVLGTDVPSQFVPHIIAPTDPPVPFPDITLPKGEVTIDIDGELKPQATIKGEIKRI